MKVAEQEPADSEQLPGTNEPAALEKVTVPPGVLALPASVSLTVAVQVDEVPSGPEDGLQLTAVALLRRLLVKLDDPELGELTADPPYEALNPAVPAEPAGGVTETLHVPRVSVQADGEGDADPLVTVQVTVPAGGSGSLVSTLETVAVQVPATPIVAGLVQLTAVVVGLNSIVTLAAVPGLTPKLEESAVGSTQLDPAPPPPDPAD